VFLCCGNIPSMADEGGAHDADRIAIADRVALIPLVYRRSMAFVKPRVKGWWEFGKTSSSFAELVIDDSSPRA
jgi:hypothetical protein